jgi:hypothetical protein
MEAAPGMSGSLQQEALRTRARTLCSAYFVGQAHAKLKRKQVFGNTHLGSSVDCPQQGKEIQHRGREQLSSALCSN